MHPRPTRRELVAGLGTLPLLVSGCGGATLQPAAGVLSEQELAEALLATSGPTQAIELAAGQLAAGLSTHVLLRATLLAGALGIMPATGAGYHAVLQTRALRRFAERLPEPLATGAILLSVFLMKNADSDYSPPDLVHPTEGEDVQAALDEAAQSWDGPAFAGAALDLLAQQGQGATRDALYTYAGRRVYYLGHDPIAVGDLLESLDALGWDAMEDVVSSIAQVLVNQVVLDGLPLREDSIAIWEEAWERALGGLEGWTAGALDPDARDALQETLSSASAADGIEAFYQALVDGVAPDSLWEAAFLDAVAMMLDGPGRGIGVHALTSLRALHHGYQTVADPDTRLHLTLLAGAWTPMLREELELRADLSFSSSLADLSPTDGALEDAFAEEGGAFGGSGDSVQAARIVLGWLEAGGDPQEYENLLLRYCLERAVEEHYFKLPVACLDLAELVSEDVGNLLRASAIIACPGSSPGLSEAWDDIEFLLEELDVAV